MCDPGGGRDVTAASPQINGVDVSDARHDQAVDLLKGQQHVTLVVYRENLVDDKTGAHARGHEDESCVCVCVHVRECL